MQNIYEPTLGIPDRILEGLKNKTMFLCDCGVVRWSKGTEYAGAIVAHLPGVDVLKAVPAVAEKLPPAIKNTVIPTQVQAQVPALGQLASLASVNVVCTAMLYTKLSNIESKVDTIVRAQEKTLADIDELQHMATMDLAKEFFQARQCFDTNEFEEAFRMCNASKANCDRFFESTDVYSILKDGQRLNYILRVLAATNVLHTRAAKACGKDIAPVLATYAATYRRIMDIFSSRANEIRQKIKPGIIPDLTREEQQILQYIKTPALKKLKASLETAESICLAQKVALEAVSQKKVAIGSGELLCVEVNRVA